MMKKALLCVFAAICLSFAGIVIADNGPADMILQAEIDTAKKPKPAVFPHALHQEIAACGDCHHGSQDGKQTPYEEGMVVEKCESCHNSGVEMPKGLGTYKDAAHKNCRDCHKQAVADNPDLAEAFKGCNPCHQ